MPATNKRSFAKDDIIRLNSLLDDTLQNAEKEQLIACVRMLGTAVASLKVRYQADDEQIPHHFKSLVEQLDGAELSPEACKILGQSIIECATAMAVTQKTSESVLP